MSPIAIINQNDAICNLLYNTRIQAGSSPPQLKISAFVQKQSNGGLGGAEDWETVEAGGQLAKPHTCTSTEKELCV